jgi:hypothetical protein
MNDPATYQQLMLECLAIIKRYDPAAVAFVRQHGDFYLPCNLPPLKCTERQCFDNCLCIAKKLPADFIYCEGFALPAVDVQPEHHAWCLNTDGDAVEFTWEQPASIYFGVAFQPTFIATWPDDEEHLGLLRPKNLVQLPDATAGWLRPRLPT